MKKRSFVCLAVLTVILYSGLSVFAGGTYSGGDGLTPAAAYRIATAADFTNCIKRGCPYGETDWVEKTAEELNLQSTLTKRGRPGKYPEDTK
ncbi:MAG: hypothetical protein FVQ82_14190 [Planctomycetes bacterium]|nr:hypothetical protein [Planctomycetota bacterium]